MNRSQYITGKEDDVHVLQLLKQVIKNNKAKEIMGNLEINKICCFCLFVCLNGTVQDVANYE